MANHPGFEIVEKKGLSGCAIAAIVVGGLVILAGAAVAIGVAVFLRSDTGHAIGETMSAVGNAERAPGTDEMRALGCTSATAIDFSAMGRLVTKFAKDAGPEDREAAQAMAGTVAVACTSTTLTCEQVAAAWGKGASPSARQAMVSVTAPVPLGATTPAESRCTGTYSRTGVKVPDSVVHVSH